MEKLGTAVGEDLRKLTESAKDKARNLREGLSQIADSLR